MSNEDRIELLEHRVRELQTAVAAIVRHLGIEHQVAEVERAQLEEIRLSGDPEAPRERLIELYGRPPSRR
jgi:hypothetical protein